MKIQRISQDIYFNQSILKTKLHLTNNIDNVVDAIGVLKVSCKLIFYNLKKKELRNDLQQGINLSKLMLNHKKEEGYKIHC
jgi:hypothetical protein